MRSDASYETNKTLNSEVASEQNVKKYCPHCMGMVFFASNKNAWEVDTCDGCGQVSRVKRKMVDNEYDAKTKEILSKVYSKKEDSRKQKGFWKKLGETVTLSP